MARTLFDLHRHVKICTISDGEGEAIKIALQAPNQAENSQLIILLNNAQVEAEAEFKRGKLKEAFELQALQWDKSQLIMLIMRMELGPTIEEADLAPNSDGTDSTVTKEQREEREEALAVKRRQDRREAVLKEMSEAELRSMMVDLQSRVSVLAQASERFSVAQLCVMVRHPEPDASGKYPRIFTDREDEIDDKCAHCGRGTPNLDYIGLLSPDTVEALNAERTKFLAEATDKKIRRQAETPDFTPSGKSPRRRLGSPGETTETPPTSLPAPSASSPAESG